MHTTYRKSTDNAKAGAELRKREILDFLVRRTFRTVRVPTCKQQGALCETSSISTADANDIPYFFDNAKAGAE